MAVTFSGSAVTAQAADLIQQAGYELGVFAPGEAISAAEANQALTVLQMLIDEWNAKRSMIFSVGLFTYALTPNLSPHTIGPTGTFQTGPAAQYRPVRVQACTFVLNSASSNPVDLQVTMRDKDWWAANPLKSQTNSIITDLFYDPAQPNGNLNFWPIPNVGGAVRLELWNNLAQAVLLTTPIAMVQGYWKALMTTLALEMCPSFQATASQELIGKQKAAIRAIFENNDTPPPRLDTTGGMPGTNRTGRPDFNFLTGMNN